MTFGCCATAAAPTAGAEPPFVEGCSTAPPLAFCSVERSPFGLLSIGGPIDEGVVWVGVKSIASTPGEERWFVAVDGRMGMLLCMLEVWSPPGNGLLRNGSVAVVMVRIFKIRSEIGVC